MTAKRLDLDALEAALDDIASSAEGRDARPAFPADALAQLHKVGATRFTYEPDGTRTADHLGEWTLLRRVAAADASVARVLDGHLNGVERLAVAADPDLRRRELAAVHEGELLLGVWGADPLPGEGEPARLVRTGGRVVLEGVKTFCSGAGGVQRALVVARDGQGPPALVYVDPRADAEVDPTWFRASGLRASESHRVVFHGTPVLAVLGGPGELARQPWFGRDAMRTAATWAGMADLAVERALDNAAHRHDDDVSGLGAGRLLTAARTLTAWLEHAAALADRDADPPELSVLLRAAFHVACTTILDEAARLCGSRPYAAGDALDRARRDLQLFLLQHRIDPLVTAVGRSALAGGAGAR